MLLAVRTSSYGCTWEVWRALKKLELLSATPRATLTLTSCSPNFRRASITRGTHAKHEPIVKYMQQTTGSFYFFYSDMDECLSPETNNCHQDADCHNMDGSFNCTCRGGYSGNGTACQGIKVV